MAVIFPAALKGFRVPFSQACMVPDAFSFRILIGSVRYILFTRFANRINFLWFFIARSKTAVFREQHHYRLVFMWVFFPGGIGIGEYCISRKGYREKIPLGQSANQPLPHTNLGTSLNSTQSHIVARREPMYGAILAPQKCDRIKYAMVTR